MNWTRDRSMLLSKICVAVFASLLLALDVFCPRIAAWYVQNRLYHFQWGMLLMVSIYCGSVFAWLCLYALWRLLDAIGRGEVFTRENVQRMRLISWCCAAASAISALSMFYYPPFSFVAIAAGFMALIVRIVKNAFEQAIAMKDELDLTV